MRRWRRLVLTGLVAVMALAACTKRGGNPPTENNPDLPPNQYSPIVQVDQTPDWYNNTLELLISMRDDDKPEMRITSNQGLSGVQAQGVSNSFSIADTSFIPYADQRQFIELIGIGSSQGQADTTSSILEVPPDSFTPSVYAQANLIDQTRIVDVGCTGVDHDSWYSTLVGPVGATNRFAPGDSASVSELVHVPAGEERSVFSDCSYFSQGKQVATRDSFHVVENMYDPTIIATHEVTGFLMPHKLRRSCTWSDADRGGGFTILDARTEGEEEITTFSETVDSDVLIKELSGPTVQLEFELIIGGGLGTSYTTVCTGVDRGGRTVTDSVTTYYTTDDGTYTSGNQ